MKDEAEIVVNRLNTHISELVSKYEELKSQNAILEKLKNRFAELELKENDLKLKQEELQFKESLVAVEGGKEGAREVIAKMIAEIDSCIYLLDE